VKSGSTPDAPGENPFLPRFLIHRSPRRAILARKKLGLGKQFAEKAALPALFSDDRFGKAKNLACGDMSSTSLHSPLAALPSMPTVLDAECGISCNPQRFGHLSGYAAHAGVG
jgi:hypothetical protein